jgi:hypothetical protein
MYLGISKALVVLFQNNRQKKKKKKETFSKTTPFKEKNTTPSSALR